MMSDDTLTHIDDKGRAHMVDVGEKPITARVAVAIGEVSMAPSTRALILTGGAAKGDVLGVARLAGIMAAKRTGDLIPLCHPLPLTSASVGFAPGVDSEGRATLWIRAEARCTGRTGVEMEAMAAASVAALTIYDMCKAVDRAMVIGRVCLWRKSGGRSGDFEHPDIAALALPTEASEWR